MGRLVRRVTGMVTKAFISAIGILPLRIRISDCILSLRGLIAAQSERNFHHGVRLFDLWKKTHDRP